MSTRRPGGPAAAGPVPGRAVEPSPGRRTGGGSAWRVALAVAVVVHLVVLYAPRSPGTGGLPMVDKVVHLAVFAAVAYTAVRAGLPWRPVLAALLAHAVVSELLQHVVLPGRSGDAYDAVADAAGAVLGTVAGSRALRRPARVRGQRRGIMGA